MQYIGRIFSSAKRMYSDLNSATLNGAIDVIVVRYPDGEYVSSPFYVQFGKTGILRPCEDEVEVSINGVLRTDLRMRVNRLGQAYFDDSDDCFRPSSPKIDSGIHLDYQSGQSPPTSESCYSPPVAKDSTTTETADGNSTSSSFFIGSNPPPTSTEEALIHSVPNLLQSVDYSEFESYMQWWSQDTSHNGEIHTYTLTNEQSEAAAASPKTRVPHDDVWVFWDDKWFSWKTANIKLRFLRNLGTALPQALESKLMELDREIPAFILLPERPPSLDGRAGRADDVAVDEEDDTQFELDQPESSGSRTLMTPSLRPLKICSDDEGTRGKLRSISCVEYTTSLPGTPREGSPVSRERAYFSDGYSPPSYSDEDGEDEARLNRRLARQWEKAHNTRAFRLSSEDLKRLDLSDGINEAIFTTINKYQGTCSCYCLIYVWKSTDKIVISDVDGTITKSDLLGHVLHWVGVEWTHLGVIQLYKKIADNGFHLMYLSARSIGQASPTRSFLEGLEQDGQRLPAGPIILSPNSLLTTIQMEIIQKRPQVLKIANLKRLSELFRAKDPNAPCPFFAGFGNRPSDVDTYREIGIPDSRIFIVNPEGVMETASGVELPTGYTALCEMVDSVFPSSSQELSQSTEYSDFSFWRSEVPPDLPKDNDPKEG